MTGEYIAFHASERPEAVAIVDNGRSITYRELARDIRTLAHALRALDLPPRSTAAIDCRDAYLNWLLRLSLERLGVVSAAVDLPEQPDTLSRMRDFDIVLSEKRFPAGAGPRHHAATTEWLRAVLASGREDGRQAPEKRPDDPIRVVLTSGTTGHAKKLLFTRHVHDTLIARNIWIAGFTARSRYLLALPSTVGAPAACIRAGGTVIIEDRMPAGEAIAEHAITHTTLPPFTLKLVLDEVPAGYAKPRELTILSLGAAVSRGLRERALARLATEVHDIYGTNEAGFVSAVSGTAEIGTVWPGARVEVVDADDRPLPFGAAGQIRVRTDHMLAGYLDDPETTARCFRNGWFYAGDVGILHDARHLQVLGRGDDVLNIGWRKIAPETIEDMVRKAVAATDVGVCSFPNADGIEEIHIAVSGSTVGNADLRQRITEAFRGSQLGRVAVLTLAGIPRTPNGKIRRKTLREIVAASIRGGR